MKGFDIRVIAVGILLFAMVTGMIAMFVAATGNVMPETRETVATYANWSDDFSADTSADYTTTGTGIATFGSGVLNLTGQDLSAEIAGETFGDGIYSMNVSFKAATNPGAAMLIVAKQ